MVVILEDSFLQDRYMYFKNFVSWLYFILKNFKEYVMGKSDLDCDEFMCNEQIALKLLCFFCC